ncbi:MAG: hypothetical protein AAF581_11585 [Planctomycetota bacterium]
MLVTVNGEKRRASVLLGVELSDGTGYGWVSFSTVGGGAYICNLPEHGSFVALAREGNTVGWFSQGLLEETEGLLFLGDADAVGKGVATLNVSGAEAKQLSLRVRSSRETLLRLPHILEFGWLQALWAPTNSPASFEYPRLAGLAVDLYIPGRSGLFSCDPALTDQSVWFAPDNSRQALRFTPQPPTGLPLTILDRNGVETSLWVRPTGVATLDRSLVLPLTITATVLGRRYPVAQVVSWSQDEIELPAELARETSPRRRH